MLKIHYSPGGKRFLDISLAAAALLILSPLFYFIAFLIKVESAGPVFFKQVRTGKNFKKFRLVKFRSMAVDNDSEKKQFEPGSSNRVTKIGFFLRKTKVDELPELFNILTGDMSIVGPRPEVEKYIEVYPDDFRKILKIQPGLSDYASIKYRNEEEVLAAQSDPEKFYVEKILPDKLLLAGIYSENVTLKTDLTIIVKTIRRIMN